MRNPLLMQARFTIKEALIKLLRGQICICDTGYRARCTLVQVRSSTQTLAARNT